MKNQNTPNSRQVAVFLSIALLGSVVFLAGCSTGPEAAEVAAKYTEQTARAIIEGSWKIAGAIVLAAVIRGVMNK